MKVLFVWPCNNNANWIPLGISILSAIAKNKGREVAFFDTTFYKITQRGYVDTTEESVKQGQYIKTDYDKKMNYESKTFEEVSRLFQDKVNSFSPDIIVVSLMTQFFELARDLMASLKGSASKIPVVVGGPHAQVATEELLQKDLFHIISVGEGEIPFIELLDNLKKGKDYTKIPGLWVKTSKGINRNELAPLRNLDDNPCPDLDIFDDRYFYQPYLTGVYRIASYEMQRGCPYKCSYCINDYLQNKTKGKGKYHRRRNMAKVIGDLKKLKNKYNLEIIRFVDETFLLVPEKELLSFAELYKREVGLPFFITTRPEGITTQKAKILSDMGCSAVSIGIEHGNPGMREKVLGRRMSNESIIAAFKNLRDVCIRSSAYNLLGIPYETRETVFDTISLNREADPDSVTAFLLFLYRNTAIYSLSMKEGLLPKDFNDEIYFHDFCDSIFKLPGISNEELCGLKKVFAAYVYLPKIIYPLIERASKSDDIGNAMCNELNKIVLDIQKQRESTKVQTTLLDALGKSHHNYQEGVVI